MPDSFGDPNCESTNASLYLIGDHLHPSRVTASLGIDPDQAEPSQEPGVCRWVLSSTDRVDSSLLERHVVWLLDRLEAAPTPPSRAPGVDMVQLVARWTPNLRADGRPFMGGPWLSPEVLARIAKLGARLVIEGVWW